MIERTLHRLEQQRPGRVSRPGDDGYAAATAIWAKPVGDLPRAVVPARRALCDGFVIDLRGMSHVSADLGNRIATIGGGARACDVLNATDPLGFAAVTGSVGAVGMAGLTLGGGYGPLSGRFGLAHIPGFREKVARRAADAK